VEGSRRRVSADCRRTNYLDLERLAPPDLKLGVTLLQELVNAEPSPPESALGALENNHAWTHQLMRREQRPTPVSPDMLARSTS
jgi:hypothetical protein